MPMFILSPYLSHILSDNAKGKRREADGVLSGFLVVTPSVKLCSLRSASYLYE